MAISKQKKEEIIKDLEDKLSRHKAAVFVDYSGLDVGAMEDIRKELRKEGIDMKIAKKTLLSLVLEKLNVSVDTKSLSGQVAVVLGYGDELAPARIISRFAKELENLKVLGGIFEKGPRMWRRSQAYRRVRNCSRRWQDPCRRRCRDWSMLCREISRAW